MDFLPTEIIILISSSLCFHCENPGVFPNADIPGVVEDKRALARLSRVSKRIRTIAQPILFHYYATGNLPRLTSDRRLYSKADDKLCAFLRSIIRRPDLATCVKCIQFVQPHSLDLSHSGLAIELLDMKNEPKPPTVGKKSDFRRALASLSPKTLHPLVDDLLTTLVPSLEALLLVRTDWSFRTASMSSLKVLSLQGLRRMYTPRQIAAVLAACPNLETLYAVDWAFFGRSDPEFSFGVLPNLKKLVLGGISLPHFKRLLHSCPSLQDIEYYVEVYEETDDTWKAKYLMDGLSAVKNTLKRFSYAHTLRIDYKDDYYRVDEFLHYSYVNRLPEWKYETYLCFSDFENLEDLAIEHASLNCRSSRNQDTVQFTTLLPPSIKKLQLMYVCPGITDPLIRLAREAPVKFPHLKCLRIGMAESIYPYSAKEYSRMKEVEPAFAEAGVEVQWGQDTFPTHPESLVPGGYVGSELFPVPTIGFQNTGLREPSVH